MGRLLLLSLGTTLTNLCFRDLWDQGRNERVLSYEINILQKERTRSKQAKEI